MTGRPSCTHRGHITHAWRWRLSRHSRVTGVIHMTALVTSVRTTTLFATPAVPTATATATAIRVTMLVAVVVVAIHSTTYCMRTLA